MDRVNHDVIVEPFSRIEVSGPMRLTLRQHGSHGSCERLHLFVNQDLIPYLAIESESQTLKLSTTTPVIPTQWISVSSDCPNVVQVKAGEFADISVSGVTRESFRAISNGGYVAVLGRLDRLEADVSAGGLINTERLHVNEARLRVDGRGYIFAAQPELYDAQATGTGEIHLFGADHHGDYSQELEMGVYLRAKDYRSGKDGSVNAKFISFGQVKRRLEQSLK
ncbi:MAG: DUF2807 domain-containing protein [Ketobacteraceae bacterium]|nr:DUF2807 domain-containing protein [Ketobacteraceae bacterium]